MTRRRRLDISRRGRRGSVFILVVAILAVLALLSLTLAYSTRMELQSSRNWVDAIQSRFSTLTGVPFFNPNQEPDPPIIGFGANKGQLPTLAGGSSTYTASSSPYASSPYASLGSAALDSQLAKRAVAIGFTISPREVARSRERAFALQSRELASSNSRGAGASAANAATLSPSRSSAAAEEAAALAAADPIKSAATFVSALGSNLIEDECAKININTVLPSPAKKPAKTSTGLAALIQPKASGPAPWINADDFALFLAAILKDAGVEASVSPEELAKQIVLYRYGPDGKPGIANVDDDGNGANAHPGSDGVDNDQDLVIDNPEEEAMSPASDGIDNNRDGQIDEPGESIENDGLDNNFDGQVDEPNEGMDDPGEFCPDPRLPPRGDDRPYRSVEDLMAVPGMTKEIYRAVEPFLTAFSVSQPAYQKDPNNAAVGVRQIDPNTASAKDMFDAIHAAFPNLPEDLIGQFVVNLIDRRDTDDIPTEATLGSAGRKYVGFEITPRINEVCPYVGTYNASADADGGDDGQFVELVNPYTRSLSVEGWRIEGGGAAVWLSGAIPAGGYLVVTDDYNDRLDPTPERTPGAGSLYAVFGAVPTDNALLVEQPTFNLPDDQGTVSLFNAQGVKVDTFNYKQGRLAGSLKRSFQRKDPLETKDLYDSSMARPATPFAANDGAAPPLTSQQRDQLALIESFQNQPFRSPIEVLLVPTNYTAAPTPVPAQPDDGSGTISGSVADPSAEVPAAAATPVSNGAPPAAGLRFTDLYAGAGDNFDARLVDVFRPLLPPAKPTTLFATPILDQNGNPQTADPNEANWKALRDMPKPLYGAVNLNTASPAVLSALPGMTESLVYKIASMRREFYNGKPDPTQPQPAATPKPQDYAQSPDWLVALPPQDKVRWRDLSEFLQDDDLWGSADFMTRFEAVYPFSMMVAFHTLSYKVTTENIPNPVASAEDRAVSTMRSARIIAGDRGKMETVLFRFFGGYDGSGPDETDKDLKFAVPAEKAPNYSEAILKLAKGESQLPVYQGESKQDLLKDQRQRQRAIDQQKRRLEAAPPPATQTF